MPDQTRVQQIEEKISDATDGELINDILSALCNMIIFHLSFMCPNCRKNIIKEIRRDLPAWVTKASQIAAEYPERQTEHKH